MRTFLPWVHHHEKALVALAVVTCILVALAQPSHAINSNPQAPLTLDPFSIGTPLVNNTTVKVNNTTNKTIKPAPTPHYNQMRLAVGGDVQFFNTADKVAEYKRLGFREVHIVVPDANPYPDVLAAIKANSMAAVYDGELPFWVHHNSNLPYSATELEALKAIRTAGWEYFASEGLYAAQVNQINAVGFKYVNYGGDRGECLYTDRSFGPHAQNSHYANYEEDYELQFKTATYHTVIYQGARTPTTNGILIAGWTNCHYGSPNVALIPGEIKTQINEMNSNGANIRTVLVWSGLGQDPRWAIKGNLAPTIADIKTLEYVTWE